LEKTFEIGGLKVTSHVEKDELNRYIEDLPPEKKGDIDQVLSTLHEEGLITIEQ